MRHAIATLFVLWSASSAHAFEVVAHRGVHQTFTRRGLTMSSCTARMIFEPSHDFLENTLRSMRQAFALGATAVELDVHPTRDGVLAVFHDWTLECRTEASCRTGCRCNPKGECITSEQTWDYLRALDIGYGYTADSGKSFPFRGRRVDAMPRFEEVLELLRTETPKGKVVVNVKGNELRTTSVFVEAVMKSPPEVRSRVQFPRLAQAQHLWDELDALGVPDALSQGSGALKNCLKAQIASGWAGHFPEACRGRHLAVPLEDSLALVHPALGFLQVPDLIWGWPGKFIERAHRHGTMVYAAQVNSVERLAEIRKLPFDGIMTDRIELLSTHLD